MSFSESSIEALRQALRVSPESVPLRRHLAEVLSQAQRWNEAEAELREALRLDPEDATSAETKVELAQVLHRQRRSSEALFLLRQIGTPSDGIRGRSHRLAADVLLELGQVERARDEYRKAVEADPSMEDEDFAEQIEPEEDDDLARGRGPSRVPLRSDDEPAAVLIEPETPTISFTDVGGLETLKEEIRLKIIHPMKHPELFAAYGKEVGGGVLLYGPPGCGKTFLARATAGEVRSPFLAVGIHDVLDMWLGQSERNLHSIFEQARRKKPCVLFFDEVDALGAKRTDLRTSSVRQIINQFLAELDGIRGANSGVLILAATNAPWHLDSALRRPGRFDRVIFVPPPDFPGRAEILRLLVRGKPAEKIDFDHLAKKTAEFSGADLKAVVDRAVEAKLMEAMRSGIPHPLTNKDLAEAAARVRPSTAEWFATARNYVLYSNQEGLYDDVRRYLKL
ncbi:MAG TPA: AAA family ATPase [Thermoanaerobaculia bacterium]|nr:AAA family ATPase [Thermoanaerobaculia bacterium]